MKIEIFSRARVLRRPLWYFRILAQNGQIVAQSEGYSRRIDCKSTACSLKTGIPNAPIVEP